jgi:phosphoserine phosphatase
MKTIIYLIRHGQTVWNAERRMQGRSDSPLTEKGIRMTERLAKDFPTIGTVYASPLGRTMQTATILFQGLEINTDDRLKEIDLGDWEGRLQADLDREDPEQHSNFWKRPHRFICPGGENFEDIQARSIECLQDLARRHEGETIAIVSHTTILRTMLFSIEKRPLSEFWEPPAVYPASVSEIHVENGVFKVIRLGDISHYDPSDIPSGAY